jgi:hypothetical protein
MSEDELERSQTIEPAQPAAGARRPYAKPELVEYGSVSKLTQGTLTRQADSPGAGFRMSDPPCL